MADEELVSRARAGDREAFEELVAAHTPAARRTATLLGAGADAEDVVQDAFVKAYRKLAEYRGDSSFRSWLLAIVANETRNLHRSRQRRAGAFERAANLAAAPADELTTEDREELLAAVAELPEADRDVIAYRYLLDLSEAETAQALDWPRGTVKSRTSRALAKLRTRLGVAVAVLVCVALVLALPPTRAAVADAVHRLLRFAGVEVEVGAPPTPTASPSPLPLLRDVTLEEARRLARFPIAVPDSLGPPQRVTIADVAADGSPRIITLSWDGGAYRLDEFDGRYDQSFVKITPQLHFTEINSGYGVWLPPGHAVKYVDRFGNVHNETTRLAGPTLIWLYGDVTLRLEGAKTEAEAVAIAVTAH
jgi:RNA polymerase sigma-70 factor (ECF subfamily)